MKIYALKDRLIDYFMQPFIGPDDKNVLASVARLVNQGDVTSDITQAPHQFEVWSLGYIAEDGHIVPEKTYLADCSSLIRAGLRNELHARTAQAHEPEIRRRNDSQGITGGNGADPSPVQGPPPAEAGNAPKAHPLAR